MHEEVWRPIKGFEELYEASSLGRIRSFDRKRRCGPGGKIVLFKGKIKKLNSLVKGYHRAPLNNGNVSKGYLVHRLIAETFYGKSADKIQVNHKNGIKTDNRLSNLEWCTRSENINHAYKLGLAPSGEKSHKAKLTKEQALEIKKSNLSLRELAKIYGINQKSVWRVRVNDTHAYYN